MKRGVRRVVFTGLACLVASGSLVVNSLAANSPTSQDAPTAVSNNWNSYGLNVNIYDNEPDRVVPARIENATSGGNRGVTSEKVKQRSDGTVKLTYLSGKSGKIVVGSTARIGGYRFKITAVSAEAFKDCKSMTTLTLPKTINFIGKKAFKGCENLKVIRLKTSKAIRVVKGAFDELETKDMIIRVNKEMPAKQVAELTKRLQEAGFKGRVV